MILSICVFVFVLFFFSFNHLTDYCYPKWFVLKCLFCVMLSYHVYLVLPVSSLLVAYALISSCYICAWPSLNHFCCGVGPRRNYQFLDSANIQFIDTVALASLFLFLPSYFIKPFFNIIPFVTIIGSVMTFFPRGTSPKLWGLGANSSVNSTLMSLLAMASLACELPYYIGIIGWAIGLLAVFRSFGSAGIGSILLGSSVYWFILEPKLVILCGAIVAVTTPLWWSWSKTKMPTSRPLVLFGVKMHPFFSLSYRETLWAFAWKELYLPFRHKLFGIGNGAFEFSFSALQQIKGEKSFTDCGSPVSWLHNDILQWWIEGGRVGVILMAMAMIELFIKGHNDIVFVSFMACYLLNSLTNFPNKMACDSFIFVMILKRMSSLRPL